MQINDEQIEILSRRIKSVCVDYLIMGWAGIMILLLTNFNLLIACLITYVLASNKDFLNGKSIGKRIFGIQVQQLNNEKANEFSCSFRNVLFIIPIEQLVILFNPERRVGDYIAKTKIGIENKLDLNSICFELRTYKINKNLLAGLFIGFINIAILLIIYERIL